MNMVWHNNVTINYDVISVMRKIAVRATEDGRPYGGNAALVLAPFIKGGGALAPGVCFQSDKQADRLAG